jgi:hypothetical protein
VWTGPIAGHPELTGWIDMVTIDLGGERCQDALTRIEVADISVENFNRLDPALTFSGASVGHCPP